MSVEVVKVTEAARRTPQYAINDPTFLMLYCHTSEIFTILTMLNFDPLEHHDYVTK